ncbi:MAG TPA: DinB family protein [Sphingobacterium sp.]|nr:DinB family protein [Sphingobacterium sp.]
MIKDAVHELEQYIVEFPQLLQTLNRAELESKPSMDKWSKKEIVGHLIDSAHNNLTRFVVAQFQDNPIIQYDQDLWCRHNYYQGADLHNMIILWEGLNRQLLYLRKGLSSDMWQRKANGNTLVFLATDYIAHFEHHLKQIKEQ